MIEIQFATREGGLVPNYSLEFQEGHQLQSDPDPRQFTAPDDESALFTVAIMLGTRIRVGKPVKKDFFARGGKAVRDGTRRLLFPPLGGL